VGPGRVASTSLACALVSAAVHLTTAAQSGNPAQAARGKLAPWVLEQTAGGQDLEFLVVLADRADLSVARTVRDTLARRTLVRDTLAATATQSQAPLLAWLRARGIPHRAFYIVNAIWVRASLQTALEIAARPEVARIEGNPRIRNAIEPPPIERGAADARVTPRTPDTVEPGVAYIHAPDVWSLGFIGQGIVVAGADTGIRWDHAALESHYRGWNGASADHNYNWHDSIHDAAGNPCGSDSTFPCDDFSVSHGTHTIGTVVGDDGGTNQIGVAPGAKFIGCRNMDQGNGTPARYIECMEWFLAPYPIGGDSSQGDPSKAPDITNNSWGCPASEGCSAGTLQSAIEAQRAAGIMTVVSAGNSGPSCHTVSDPPSIYDASYTVGAIDAGTGSIASFSSRGSVTADGSGRLKPDVSAPGVNVRSAQKESTTAYGSLSGTSMAGPHVAGAVALLWSVHPELRHDITATEDVLNAAAVAVSDSSCGGTVPNNVYGYGRLDIRAAVDPTASNGVSTSPAAGRTSGGQQVTLTGSFANLSAVSIGGVPVSWSYSNGTSSIAFTTPPHAAGAVDIALTAVGGRTYSKPHAFAYLPTTFTDNSLVAGTTVAKAQHILELRQAVDSMRAVAGLGAASWTDTTLTPFTTVVKADHIIQLRSFLENAAALLGYSSGTYTDPSLAPGAVIKRVHIEELRQRIRDIAG
jgi:serine protease AprX